MMNTDNDNSVADRINEYLSVKGISRAQFADACGIPRPTVTQILSGRNKKIGNDTISAIHSSYPDISISWLLFGEGKQFAEELNCTKVHENSIFEEILDSGVQYGEEIESKSGDKHLKSQIINEKSPKKQIQKIVVFYSDNSFEEFFSR